jgi:hypothetical protein
MQQIPAFSPLIIVLNSTTQASVITFQVLKIVLLSVIIRTAVRKHWHRLRDFWLPPLRRWIIRSSGMLHSVCSIFRCQAVFCGSSRGLFDLWRLYWKALPKRRKNYQHSLRSNPKERRPHWRYLFEAQNGVKEVAMVVLREMRGKE